MTVPGSEERVRTLLRRAVRAGLVVGAVARWGREDDDRGFPEREQPHLRLVFRDVQRWEDLIRHTDILDESLRLLRPPVDAVLDGAAEAKEVCR